MNKLRVVDFGTEVQGVQLRGDPRSPEPESFRVRIPGGDVDVVRTSDGEYWVHVRVDSERDVATGGAERAGKIVDARLDVRGVAASQTSAGDFGHPDLYHLAVRVARR